MPQAMPMPLLEELFAYNYWARDRHLQACAELTEEQFLRPLESSFPSLRDTFVHLVGVEWLWLERWRGRSPKALLLPEEFPTMAVLVGRWNLVESEMKGFLAQLSQETLDRPVSYENFLGQTWTYPLWRMLVHLVNHQSYHRGQVASLLRRLGIHPPSVDFLVSQDMELRL